MSTAAKNYDNIRKYYDLGREDAANEQRYPLYSVLVCANENELAAEYARGFKSRSGVSLVNWKDGRKR